MGSSKNKQYVIKSGDTMWDIAHNNGISLDTLIRANKKVIKNPRVIFPGQIIKIPYKNTISFDDIVVGITALVFIFGAIFIGAYIMNWFVGTVLSYKPLVCHYEYVDTEGNNGTASMCKNSWGTLYCGEAEWAVKVNKATKVCE